MLFRSPVRPPSPQMNTPRAPKAHEKARESAPQTHAQPAKRPPSPREREFSTASQAKIAELYVQMQQMQMLHEHREKQLLASQNKLEKHVLQQHEFIQQLHTEYTALKEAQLAQPKQIAQPQVQSAFKPVPQRTHEAMYEHQPPTWEKQKEKSRVSYAPHPTYERPRTPSPSGSATSFLSGQDLAQLLLKGTQNSNEKAQLIDNISKRFVNPSDKEQDLLKHVWNYPIEALKDADADLEAAQQEFILKVLAEKTGSEDVEVNLTKYKKLYPHVRGTIAANHLTWPAFIIACQSQPTQPTASAKVYAEDIKL